MATADDVDHFPQISLTDIIGNIFDDGFDADFHTETNMDVENLVAEVADYPCNDCNKHYKTKGGLRRHQKSKHQPFQKNIIDHLQLKGIIEKAAVKLSDDFCFDESVRKAFSLFKISTDESSLIWNQLKDIFEKFSGNAEKFFTSFYGFLQPGKPVLFAQISRYQSTLLSTEVANQFLALANAEDTTQPISRSDINFSEKDIASLEYLAGYCFRTVYARLRNSSKHRSVHSQQSMSVLQAGKCNSDAEMPVQRLVDVRDRGGLWKVDERVQAIFRVSEMEFLIASFGFQTKIDAESLVSKLLKDLVIRSNFSINYPDKGMLVHLGCIFDDQLNDVCQNYFRDHPGKKFLLEHSQSLHLTEILHSLSKSMLSFVFPRMFARK